MPKKMLYGLTAGALSALAALGLWRTGILDRIEYTTWNWRVQALAEPGAATERIKIILLDQYSLDWGRRDMSWSWPWPRVAYTALIDFCRRGGASSVAFDVLFTEPSVYQVSDDEALGAATGAKPDVIHSVFIGNENGDFTTWPGYLAQPSAVRVNPDVVTSFQGVSGLKAVFPVPEIATNSVMLANVSDDPDRDGVFRRASLFRAFAGHPLFSLGMASYLATRPGAGVALAGGGIAIDGRVVPVDGSGRAVLRFRGASQTHKTYNAAEVIQSELKMKEGSAGPIANPGVFTNCHVFIGFSAPGLMDLRPTPISRVYPGVEIHATALDNFLSGDFIREARPSMVALATLLLAIVAACSALAARRAWHSVAALVCFLPLPVIAGFAAYPAGIWWPVVVQGVAVLFALVSAGVINYATEGRQKAFIKQAFKYYLSPEVIEKIIDDPSQLKLGGERRELTIFFSDLQGFSSFSEKLDPPALTALLNDYLSDMTDIILEEGGTLDKYEGDAIIAFWNAPVSQEDHAARACRTAIRCQRKLSERREDFKSRTGVELKMRIGMHTGEVVVGNMGSAARFNYTVLGDAANLASRLEGANKAFGTYLMVSEVAWKKAGAAVVGYELGRLRVVGRAQPVRVYEVVGVAGETRPQSADLFEEALARLTASDVAGALGIFERIPDSPPSQRYAEKCRQVLAQNGTWDGIWNLTEK